MKTVTVPITEIGTFIHNIDMSKYSYNIVEQKPQYFIVEVTENEHVV